MPRPDAHRRPLRAVLIAALLTGFVWSSQPPAAVRTDVKSLAWMVGCWQTTSGGDPDPAAPVFAPEVEAALREHKVDTVMHFAAHTVVPESVSDPLKYYRNNTASSRTLLEVAHRHGVKHVVFSSTAAVYGILDGPKASEDSPTQPINPYGTSKLMTEWMLRDLAAAEPERTARLRRLLLRACDGNFVHGTPEAHFAFYDR